MIKGTQALEMVSSWPRAAGAEQQAKPWAHQLAPSTDLQEDHGKGENVWLIYSTQTLANFKILWSASS